MDIEDEMIVRPLKEEQAFDDDIREHLSIIASLQNMLDAEAEKRKRPRHGGSKPRKKKSKPRTTITLHMKQHKLTIFGAGIL
jgi:predicted transposase YbfD/YdcC